MSTAADFFGGNAKSASFDGKPAIKHAGIVDRIGAPVQATEYVRPGSGLVGKPQFYPSGDPVMQLPVTLLTDARDPAVPSDDGRRTIYFEGEKRKALKTALRTVGAREPILGDWMSLEYYADQQGQGAYPKKLYRAEYAINPDQSKRGAGYFPPDGDPAAVAQPVAHHVPQAQTVPAHAQAQPTWDQQVAAGGTAPAFAQPAAAASPFAPVAQTQEAWPPANGANAAPARPVGFPTSVPAAPGFSTTAQPSNTNGNGAHVAASFAGTPGAAPVNTAGPVDQGQPLAAARPWGNVAS